MKAKIEAIIAKELPKFYFRVENSTFCGNHYIHINIAASDYFINGVRGQFPQHVGMSLCMEEMILQTAYFGCSGGGCIYRKINPDVEREKFYAMQRIKVPFRQPNKNEVSVLRAIEKFCREYKRAIADNMDVLMYQDNVDYESLLK